MTLFFNLDKQKSGFFSCRVSFNHAPSTQFTYRIGSVSSPILSTVLKFMCYWFIGKKVRELAIRWRRQRFPNVAPPSDILKCLINLNHFFAPLRLRFRVGRLVLFFKQIEPTMTTDDDKWNWNSNSTLTNNRQKVYRAVDNKSDEKTLFFFIFCCRRCFKWIIIDFAHFSSHRLPPSSHHGPGTPDTFELLSLPRTRRFLCL